VGGAGSDKHGGLRIDRVLQYYLSVVVGVDDDVFMVIINEWWVLRSFT
jgi:hypothetical protein